MWQDSLWAPIQLQFLRKNSNGEGKATRQIFTMDSKDLAVRLIKPWDPDAWDPDVNFIAPDKMLSIKGWSFGRCPLEVSENCLSACFKLHMHDANRCPELTWIGQTVLELQKIDLMFSPPVNTVGQSCQGCERKDQSWQLRDPDWQSLRQAAILIIQLPQFALKTTFQ